MDLFNPDPITSILPADGTALYYGRIFSYAEAEHYLERLLHHIDWKNDEAIIFGKHIITKRKAAWYGDQPYAYTYSNTTKLALPWTDDLLKLKNIAEQRSGATYNSCLLNLYHTGEEAMAWHSDDEKTLAHHAPIASLSFGAERMFGFKHKHTGETHSLLLENGSLLVMKDETQTYWLHRLAIAKKILRPRVNITFRTIVV